MSSQEYQDDLDITMGSAEDMRRFVSRQVRPMARLTKDQRKRLADELASMDLTELRDYEKAVEFANNVGVSPGVFTAGFTAILSLHATAAENDRPLEEVLEELGDECLTSEERSAVIEIMRTSAEALDRAWRKVSSTIAPTMPLERLQSVTTRVIQIAEFDAGEEEEDDGEGHVQRMHTRAVVTLRSDSEKFSFLANQSDVARLMRNLEKLQRRLDAVLGAREEAADD